MVSRTAVVLVLSALVSKASAGFLSAQRTVNSASVRTDVEQVLAEVLGEGHGVANERLSKIHKTVDPLFRSLPKNNQGHISGAVMRYAVQRFFSQNHGWRVKGFGVHEEAMDTSSAADTEIAETQLIDYVRSLLEERFAHSGFSLDALVTMIASVERLAFDEVVKGVERGFYFNSFDRDQTLSFHELIEVVSSYMITEIVEDSEVFDMEKYWKVRDQIQLRHPHWDTTIVFLEDNIGSDVFRRRASSNPFADATYSFEDAVRLSEQASAEFGSWSHHECIEMKDMLTAMDHHHTGRVKLAEFYGYTDAKTQAFTEKHQFPEEFGAWQFLEPLEQLQYSGALDESSAWLGPQVMIPNYINGWFNCITSAPYYQICCLNECDQVFQHLESQIAAPSASSSEIISALEHQLERNISALHRERLDEIARVNDGQIPIYGRLFARWIHFVYPQECAYPHAAGVVKPMTVQELKSEKEVGATVEDIAHHKASVFAHRAASPDAGALMWSLDEALLESSTPSDLAASPMRALLHIVPQISMAVGFLSIMLKTLMQTFRSDAKSKPVEYDV